MVLADKAYHSEARSQALESLSILNGIMRQAKPNHPQDKMDEQLNAVLSVLRAAAERDSPIGRNTGACCGFAMRACNRNAQHPEFVTLMRNIICINQTTQR